MMSLPFMYGFVNDCWSTVVDAMLKKKRNSRKIHQLQIIGILEVDLNIALEKLVVCKLTTNAKII